MSGSLTDFTPHKKTIEALRAGIQERMHAHSDEKFIYEYIVSIYKRNIVNLLLTYIVVSEIRNDFKQDIALRHLVCRLIQFIIAFHSDPCDNEQLPIIVDTFRIYTFDSFPEGFEHLELDRCLKTARLYQLAHSSRNSHRDYFSRLSQSLPSEDASHVSCLALEIKWAVAHLFGELLPLVTDYPIGTEITHISKMMKTNDLSDCYAELFSLVLIFKKMGDGLVLSFEFMPEDKTLKYIILQTIKVMKDTNIPDDIKVKSMELFCCLANSQSVTMLENISDIVIDCLYNFADSKVTKVMEQVCDTLYAFVRNYSYLMNSYLDKMLRIVPKINKSVKFAIDQSDELSIVRKMCAFLQIFAKLEASKPRSTPNPNIPVLTSALLFHLVDTNRGNKRNREDGTMDDLCLENCDSDLTVEESKRSISMICLTELISKNWVELNDEIISQVGALFDDKDFQLRKSAILAFVAFVKGTHEKLFDEFPIFIRHLLRLMKDKNYYVRLAACWALFRFLGMIYEWYKCNVSDDPEHEHSDLFDFFFVFLLCPIPEKLTCAWSDLRKTALYKRLDLFIALFNCASEFLKDSHITRPEKIRLDELKNTALMFNTFFEEEQEQVQYYSVNIHHPFLKCQEAATRFFECEY